MEQSDLLVVVTDFVTGLLTYAKVDHAGNCLAVSKVLQSYLGTFFGIKTTLIKVKVEIELDGGRINHYCLQMKDKIIIDATASQFKNMPKVYIGKKPLNYK